MSDLSRISAIILISFGIIICIHAFLIDDIILMIMSFGMLVALPIDYLRNPHKRRR